MLVDLAPIVLFTYNRLWHTQQTVEALKMNDLASDSRLVIYSDGPKTEKEIIAVENVRQYLWNIDGFKSIEIIENKENMGLAQSIVKGVTDQVQVFGKVIVLEDDLVTSPYFLRFMNDGLMQYDEDDRVISIHGYMYPVKGMLPETFFLRGADCWGWATWKRGWNLYENDGQKLLSHLNSRGLLKRFDFNGAYPYTKMLRNTIKGKVSSWAVKWYASAFLENKLTLYPGRSLVNNIGIDTTGVHCGASDWFSVEQTERPIHVGWVNVEENSEARDAIIRFFFSLKWRISTRAINFIKRRIL